MSARLAALTSVKENAESRWHCPRMFRSVSLAPCLACLTAGLARALGLLALAAVISAAPSSAETPEEKAERVAGELADVLAQSLAPAAGARLEHHAAPVPHWRLVAPGKGVLAAIGSSRELVASTGYSGRPLDLVVAVGVSGPGRGKILGVRLASHAEPVLTLGLSDEDFARFAEGFSGIDLSRPLEEENRPPPAIARATVTSGVMRDAVLRTARLLAEATGAISGGGIDRTAFRPAGWAELSGIGAIATASLSLQEARAQMASATVPPPEGEGDYVRLHVALIDPPTIGRNLLGEHLYARAMAELLPGQSVLFVGSSGLVGHRGTRWRRKGVFETLTIRQGETRFHPSAEGFIAVDKLAAADAPPLEQMSLFRLPAEGFDPAQPFTVELTIARPARGGGTAEARLAVNYAVPAEFRSAPTAPPPASWEEAWAARWPVVVGVGVQLGVLFLILLFQTVLVRHKRLWLGLRAGFLAVTFLWLGLWVGGQLSVVQVAAFLHALLSGFRWETFLIEPVIFTLWSFVALGLLFWGRGVYCGWLCPFGAAQELANIAARRLGIRQIAVPHAVHERLWLIKYTAFVAIIAVSFHSMEKALLLAEIEPFKTAITLRMMRAWPFVLFVVALLAAGLFIERFYCRYLCPLGAGLAIPARLRIFDWLDRRPQCGRECRLCEQRCTAGAIDPIGRINPNECLLCLRCQMIYHDPETCVVLKRRARAAATT
jgi:NosR/NirI family nitrite reductase transcriptional regulator